MYNTYKERTVEHALKFPKLYTYIFFNLYTNIFILNEMYESYNKK